MLFRVLKVSSFNYSRNRQKVRRYWQIMHRNKQKVAEAETEQKVRSYWHIVHRNRQKVCTRIAPNPTKHNWECVLGVCRLDVPYLRHRPCAKPSPIQLGLCTGSVYGGGSTVTHLWHTP